MPGNAEVSRALVEGITDDSADVRALALTSAAEHVERGNEDFIRGARQALRDEDKEVRKAACQGLGKVCEQRDKDTARDLLKICKNPGEDPLVSLAANVAGSCIMDGPSKDLP